MYMTVYLTGYNNVAVIPKGASNIRIEQHGFGRSKEDGIYLGETPTTATYCVCALWRHTQTASYYSSQLFI